MPSFFFFLRMIFLPSSRRHSILGSGVPSALQISEALLFSRTLTVEGELSKSEIWGGTENVTINVFLGEAIKVAENFFPIYSRSCYMSNHSDKESLIRKCQLYAWSNRMTSKVFLHSCCGICCVIGLLSFGLTCANKFGLRFRMQNAWRSRNEYKRPISKRLAVKCDSAECWFGRLLRPTRGRKLDRTKTKPRWLPTDLPPYENTKDTFRTWTGCPVAAQDGFV